MHMLKGLPAGEVNVAAPTGAARRRRRQMHIALMLLLTALALVLVKDRQFWFGPLLTAGSEAADQTASDSQSQRHVTPAKSRAKSNHAGVAVLASDAQATVSGEVTQRAVLPPLAVEVIYGGGQRRTLQARDSSLNLDLQHNSYVAPAPAGSGDPEPATGPLTRKAKSKVAPVYPDLARRMSITGTVKLSVVVTPNGTVKSTKLVGGHPLLANAAMDAMKKWKFEPGPDESTGIVEFKFQPQD